MKTVLLFLLLTPTILWAQLVKITSQDTQRKQSYLLMRDGTTLRGHIVRQDSSIITVRKHNGDMSFVEADQVMRISPSRPDDPAPVEGYGASPALYTVFVLKDGTQLEGAYIRRDSTMITVRKRNGQLTYFEPELLTRVDTIRRGETSYELYAVGDQVFSNRFSPWLLTGQTAYTAEKGQFYYRNTLLVHNEFIYGITRNWSVGASFVTPLTYLYLFNFYAFNGFLPTNSQLFTKLSVPLSSQFRLGLNITYLDKYNSYSRRGALTYQALASVGSSQRNVTLGFGLVDRGKQRYYVNQPIYSSSIPTYVDVHIPNQLFLTLGIMQKVSPMLTLISDSRINLGTDQYAFSDHFERASLSFAFRFDRRRHAFDMGLYSLLYRPTNTFDGRQVRFLPYLGYNLLMGGK